jgi:hypothetical protein
MSSMRKRGALPVRPGQRSILYSTMRYARGAPTLPAIPAALDWMRGMDRSLLGTLGNAPDPKEPNMPLVGDCGIVSMYRFIQVERFKLAGSFLDGTALTPCALQTYGEISGWQPSDPASDTGINLQDGLDYWMNTGIVLPDGTRHRIAGFFKVDPSNDAELREVVAVCGGAYVGQDIPDAYDSSNEGDTWDLEGPGTGGHCTGIFAYTPGVWDMESWAMRFPETDRAKNAYMTEAWAVVSPTWANGTGQTPFNMTLAEVDAAMTSLQA